MAFLKNQSRFKGFSGPIGSGKSQALCQEALRSIFQNPGRVGLIGAPTYQMLRDTTQRALFEALEDSGLGFTFNKAENSLIVNDGGSQVIFRSLDDPDRLRGTNLAWFGVDELTYVAEEAWARLEGRLRDPKATRLSGFAVWTPKGFDWVYRKFIGDAVEGTWTIQAEPFENTHLLAKTPDFYERLKKSYDEHFYQQEVLGSYVNMSGGLVYKCFSRHLHVKPAQIDLTKPLLWALDFNVDPMASVVVQVEDGTARVIDEIFIRRATTREACEEFLTRYPNHSAGVRIYGDASGNSSHTTGPADYEMIRNIFRLRGRVPEHRVPRQNPPVRERIAVVNGLLKNAADEVHLTVDPRCRELIKDFEQLSFKEGTMIPDKDKDDQRSHVSDALGYVLWQERQKGSTGEQGGRLV